MKSKISDFHVLMKRGVKLTYAKLVSIVYLAVFSTRFFSNLGTVLTGVMWFASGVLVFAHLTVRKRVKKQIVCIMALIDIIGFANGVVNGNDTYMQALYVFSAQMFGVLIYYSLESLKLSRLFFWMAFLYISLRIVFLPTIDIHGERAVSNLIGHSSASIIMIASCVIDLFANKTGKYKKSYILYFLGIVVSYIADSNGGVVCFAVFIIGIYMCSEKGNKLVWWKILLIVLGGVGTLYVTGYLEEVVEFATDDNSRLAIWGMYFSIATLNIKNFLIGAPMTDNVILYTFYNNNMHNTFINWHVYFGLIPTIAYFSVVLYEIIYYIKNKKWIYVIAAGTLLIRSLPEGTDYCFMTLWTYMLFDIIHEMNRQSLIWHKEKKA